MNEISDLDGVSLPSVKTLLRATGAALLVAVTILFVAILPAEYGIDPTGVGGRLGLIAMSSSEEERVPPAADEDTDPAADPAPIAAGSAAWRSDAPYRTDQAALTLLPGEGAEIKALMRSGERFVFSWTSAGGAVFFDMHGERPNAGSDEFSSYWKARAETGGNGAFVAPFAGSHGWYWENRGKAPVTILLNTSGFYEKLYRPL